MFGGLRKFVEVVSADVGHGACWEVHNCESVSVRQVSQILFVV